MALFQRTPQRQNIMVPYTITNSARKQLLVVGLGNIGKEYAHTRHNAGFDTLDYFANQNNFEKWQLSKKLKGYISQSNINDTSVILLKPTTLMNLSGDSVYATINYYKIKPKEIVVVYDELSLNFGQIRMRESGQSAGHNGIKSIISQIGPDFARIRIGIKNDNTKITDNSSFVLAKFAKNERSQLDAIYNEASAVIIERIYSGSLPNDTRSILLV